MIKLVFLVSICCATVPIEEDDMNDILKDLDRTVQFELADDPALLALARTATLDLANLYSITLETGKSSREAVKALLQTDRPAVSQIVALGNYFYETDKDTTIPSLRAEASSLYTLTSYMNDLKATVSHRLLLHIKNPPAQANIPAVVDWLAGYPNILENFADGLLKDITGTQLVLLTQIFMTVSKWISDDDSMLWQTKNTEHYVGDMALDFAGKAPSDRRLVLEMMNKFDLAAEDTFASELRRNCFSSIHSMLETAYFQTVLKKLRNFATIVDFAAQFINPTITVRPLAHCPSVVESVAREVMEPRAAGASELPILDAVAKAQTSLNLPHFSTIGRLREWRML